MERLSDAAIEIINDLHTERLEYASEYIPLIDAANRLAAYEDTGMEPDQVEQIRRASEKMMFESVGDFVRYAIANFEKLQQYQALYPIDNLIALFQAEQEGRLVVLNDETLLALQAVVSGCNSNRKLIGASYMRDIYGKHGGPKIISYYQAILNMMDIVGKALKSNEAGAALEGGDG